MEHHKEVVALSCTTKQHLAALTLTDKQVDLTALGVKIEQQFAKLWKEIPQEAQ